MVYDPTEGWSGARDPIANDRDRAEARRDRVQKRIKAVTSLCAGAFALLATTVLAALNPQFAALGPADIADIWHRFEIGLDKPFERSDPSAPGTTPR